MDLYRNALEVPKPSQRFSFSHPVKSNTIFWTIFWTIYTQKHGLQRINEVAVADKFPFEKIHNLTKRECKTSNNTTITITITSQIYQIPIMSTITSITLLIVLLISAAAAGRLGEPDDETRRLATSGVNLGTAGDFAILSKAGVTTTGVTSVTGDMGTSPIASTAITGFGLTMDSTVTFSTSASVEGNIYAASYTSPTPSKMTTAISDMETAYLDAAGRTNPDHMDLDGGNLEGKTLEAGLYKWGTNVYFANSLTFDGSSTDIWILQIAQNLVVGNGAQVTLSGGALWKNIYWQVCEAAEFGTTSHVEGVFIVKEAITFKTGSSLNGAALAQTAVTLDAATIVN